MKTQLIKRIFQLLLIYAIHNNIVFAQPPSNPAEREICLSSGGSVTETGYRDIYICCFIEKQICVVSDIQQGYSRLIPLVKNHNQVKFY